MRRIRAALQTRMNLEMAATEAMIAFARELAPQDVCLVPEKREEVTTEGGLDVEGQVASLRDCCLRLAAAGSRVSLFIDPDPAQLEAAVADRCAGRRAAHRCVCGGDGSAAGEGIDAGSPTPRGSVASLGLTVHAGHGLHYHNVRPIAAIEHIVELNIGHAIVARAVIDGMAAAVRDMKSLLSEARRPGAT